MVSEPEAAAIYTARYLKEMSDKEFLKASLLFQLSLWGFLPLNRWDFPRIGA